MADKVKNKLNDLLSNLNLLKENMNQINNDFNKSNDKLKYLEDNYQNLLKNNNDKLKFTNLENLNFQYILYNNDYKYFNNKKNIIFNRIYYEYLKIYKNFIYIIETKFFSNIVPIKEDFTYDYLKVDKIYLKDDYEKIFSKIFDNIYLLLEYFNDINIKLQDLEKLKNDGLNIINLITTCQYEKKNVQEEIKLIISYLENTIILQLKYLSIIKKEINDFNNNLNNEIKF